MTLLPEFGRAVIPLEKLDAYVLNDQHPEGMHKASVFRQLLGIKREHAPALAELIKKTLQMAPAQKRESDEFGERWTTYHRITGFNNQTAIVTVGWIIRKDSAEAPTLTTCYIDSDEQSKLERLFD
jgi:hypothetical protein